MIGIRTESAEDFESIDELLNAAFGRPDDPDNGDEASLGRSRDLFGIGCGVDGRFTGH